MKRHILSTSTPTRNPLGRTPYISHHLPPKRTLLANQERTRRTRGRVYMTRMRRPWVPTGWRRPRAPVMAENPSSARYGGSSTAQPQKQAIYISDDQHEHMSRTNRTNMDTHLFKRAPNTRRTPTPMIPLFTPVVPTKQHLLVDQLTPVRSPPALPNPNPSPGPTRFFPFLTEVEAKDAREQHTPTALMSTTSGENGAWAIAEDLPLFCWVVNRTAVVDLVAGKTARRSPHLYTGA